MKLNFEDFYQQFLDVQAAFQLANSTMYVDQNTIAPKKGAAATNKAMGILSQFAFEQANDPELIAQIQDYYARLPEDSLEKKELGLRLEQIADLKDVPADVYGDYVKTRADSETLWHEAKEAKDYGMFRDMLENIMTKQLNLYTYSPRYTGDNAYELALDAYEKGMDSAQYDEFFAVIKEDLIPLIQKVTSAKQIDTTFLDHEVDVDKQAVFNEKVLDFLGRDKGRVYLSTTEHPFTDFLSRNDNRITTHYYPNAFLSAVLSTVHEYGHALYSMQMDPALENTMFDAIVGSAAHESQSRFLENHIGRSYAFWKALYPELVKEFPEFADVTPEELARMINASVPGLIRTEADELTYPLHILIRYEIEKMIADGTLDYDKLPEIWADKYEQYLSVRPENDAEGVLQDMHWSAGYLGYFPTYALGSAYAAQIYEAMCKDLDPEKELAAGNTAAITNWLQEHVHQYGGTKTMKQITEEVSCKPFDPHIYTNYLKDKYTRLYGLEDQD